MQLLQYEDRSLPSSYTIRKLQHRYQESNLLTRLRQDVQVNWRPVLHAQKLPHCHIQCSTHTRQALHAPLHSAILEGQPHSIAQSKSELRVVVRPPWQAEGQGKARRLFEADQGPSKRVISLARDQTMLKLTSPEFKDRLADVLCLLPELPLSALPPKMVAKLVMTPPSSIADQLVRLQSLFRSRQDINELLLKEPSLLTMPFSETAVHFQRLESLLCSPRKKGGQHPYTKVDFDDFVATHPQFLIPENVVLAMKALCIYLGRAMQADATVQDYIAGNPGMLLKGYKHVALTPVMNVSGWDNRFDTWWLPEQQRAWKA